MFNELRRFNENTEKSIHTQWKELFLKIEVSFEEVADHLEAYNGYYGAWYEFGLLHMPMKNPCSFESPCKLCRIASANEKDRFDKRARHNNNRYLFQVSGNL